jgi:ABC-type Zn uptake system ZnuABC Zn-binding protein ZnuA
MTSFIRGALALLFLTIPLQAQAAVRILATTADWGALATELGGERVDVYTATTAMQDVHRVDAKPSLVARARTADLWSRTAQSSRSAGCRCSCRKPAMRASSAASRATSSYPRR